MYSPKRLQEEIHGKGRRASWVAEQAGFDRTTIYRYMDGSRNITDDAAHRIADVLEIPVERLLEESGVAA